MPTKLRLFPLNAVLFPGSLLNLHVFEPRYKQLVAECLHSGEGFGVVLIRDGQEAGDPSIEPHQIGSVAEIVEVTQLPFGRYYLSTVGRQRFRIRRILEREPYLTVEADLLVDCVDEADLEELSENVRSAFGEYLELLVAFSGRDLLVELPSDANAASFLIGDALQVGDIIKQRLLELDSAKARLTAELAFLRRLLPQLRSLLERREAELQARRERGDDGDRRRADQERYFGKYFSAN